MNPYRLRRVLAGAGVLFVAVLGFASPAGAESTTLPSVDVATYNISIAPNAGHIESISIKAPDSVTQLVNPVYTFDLGKLASFITVTPTFDADVTCTPSGSTVTCTASSDAPVEPGYWNGVFDATFSAKADAPIGATGTVTTTVSGDNVAASSHASTVTIAQGVDLTALPGRDVTTTPGSSFTVSAGVHNSGDADVTGTVLVFEADYAQSYATRYSNCSYGTGYADAAYAVCTFDSTLQAGHTYNADVPMTLGKDNMAPAKIASQWEWLTAQDWADVVSSGDLVPGLTGGVKGAGPALALRDVTSARSSALAQTDTNPDDNGGYMTVTVTGNNPADLAALGATLSGKGGDIVATKVGVRNNGPATVFPSRGLEPIVVLDVKIPEGTTVTSISSDCAPANAGKDGPHFGQPGASEYECVDFTLAKAGQSVWFPVSLRIDTVIANATGTVTLRTSQGTALGDPNPANDTAKIIVNAPAGTGGTGGGGAMLPITGVKAGLIGGAGVLIVAFGIVFFVLNRRRRTRFVVED